MRFYLFQPLKQTRSTISPEAGTWGKWAALLPMRKNCPWHLLKTTRQTLSRNCHDGWRTTAMGFCNQGEDWAQLQILGKGELTTKEHRGRGGRGGLWAARMFLRKYLIASSHLRKQNTMIPITALRRLRTISWELLSPVGSLQVSSSKWGRGRESWYHWVGTKGVSLKKAYSGVLPGGSAD